MTRYATPPSARGIPSREAIFARVRVFRSLSNSTKKGTTDSLIARSSRIAGTPSVTGKNRKLCRKLCLKVDAWRRNNMFTSASLWRRISVRDLADFCKRIKLIPFLSQIKVGR